jgi:fluoroacetyl-CoA thioesterase
MLAPGLVHEQSLRVTPALTVPRVSLDLAQFADMPAVFATAFLVAFVEDSCIAAIRPFLAPGQHSVGTHVDLSHTAATPVGMTVTARVELVAVEGRTLTFQVACRDGRESIGAGRHERMVIDLARFEARVAAKAANLPA